jgi:hypothetical protein
MYLSRKSVRKLFREGIRSGGNARSLPAKNTLFGSNLLMKGNC